jgi:hypothetical protein
MCALAVPPRQPLRFGHGNAKLDSAVFTFSLPAGHSCPFALDCLCRANRETGTIRDGPQTRFRCYAASMEARHPSVRRSRWFNYEALRGCRSTEEMTELILDSLSPFAGYVRVHDGGDFFSEAYFLAWLEVARQRPRTTFYAYTKTLAWWVRNREHVPNTFLLTASTGGKQDHLISEHNLRFAQVVYSEQEAKALDLSIDHDDCHAMCEGPSFALLLHGTQPKDSEAGRAVQEMRAAGTFSGYGPSRRLTLAVI